MVLHIANVAETKRHWSWRGAATFRVNRIASCPLMADNELRTKGRGSYDYPTDNNSGLHIVKWWNNKGVNLGSTFAGVGASEANKKKRWDGKLKQHVDVQYPDVFSKYKQGMVGVDLNDMLIQLCRVNLNVKKRWYQKIIGHCVNIRSVNGWLLYKRFCEQMNIAKHSQCSLLHITKEVGDALISAGKPKDTTVG